ncbi:conjugal transfer protein TraH [Helicobacter colisuis]|uniref:conjugal transfer protein TraH n=1 Tax=Helicobacter colisuis TaxID=2949739 RepID=UPI00202AA8B1|nr:conjugal transfer protein TraH [Helicobacter colisuis]MCL9823406.1 conjugal transfer protein TraH [Helicobacter colisuis]
MEVLRKNSLGLMLVMGLSISSANAGISDFIQGALNSSTTETSAGYYKSQVSGLATLGGARVRWGGLDNVRPFNVQTPSINIGCSGIDMVFGGFSYLNFEYLIEKLKKISTAAPAFAFKMALSTLCKDCDTIMTALEDISNTINNLNFDSCQALSNWSDRAGEKLSGIGLTGVQGGQTSSWLQGMNDGLSQWVEKTNAFINGQGNNNADGSKNTTNIFSQGSILQRGLKNTENMFKQLMGEAEYEKILRAVFGDVVGHIPNKANTQTGEKEITPTVSFLAPTIKAEDFAKTLSGDKNNPEKSSFTITKWEIKERADGMYSLNDLGKEKIELVSYFGILNKQIKAIINKGLTDQALDQTDINLLNSLELPTWHLINIAIANNLNADPYIEIISASASVNIIKKFANTIYSDIATIVAQAEAKDIWNTDTARTAIRTFKKNIDDISTRIYVSASEQISKNNDLVMASEILENLYKTYLSRTKGAGTK